MATVNCPGLTSDSGTRGQSATWATARSTGTAVWASTDTTFIGFQVAGDPGPMYYIDRGWWRFDTSVIGAGAVVTAATLNWDVTSTGNLSLNDSFTITGGTIAAGTGALVASDHGNVGSTEFITAIAWGSYGAGSYSTALNASGCAYINVTGETVLVGRGSRDVANSAPPATSNYSYNIVGSSNHGTPAMRPSLDVTYTVPRSRPRSQVFFPNSWRWRR